MIEKTFEFDEPTLLNISGRTSTGVKKVSERNVVKVTVTKRKPSVGFSWETASGESDSILYSDHEIDITIGEVREWFESASP